MKRNYVNELAEGTKVDAPFALRSKEMRAARTGDAYLALELADRTGQVSAVWFRPQQDATTIPVGSVVRVRGTVTSFRGAKRVSVESIRAADTWDPEDLLASGPRSTKELSEEFSALVRTVKDAQLSRVLRAVFGDRDFFERFCDCPGSQSYHHAYRSGLLEHTVAVASLCRALCEVYADVDRDLLVTAALLHDIGKCDELMYDTAIEFTNQGRFLGHVLLGMRRIDHSVARARLRIPPERLTLLEHAVLSHHGELEWGAPKRPSTIEALLLHHADNLDAKASGFAALLGGASRAEESWTDSANLFRRPLWAPRAAEDDRVRRPSEDVVDSCLSA
jgi:3'-5' exoribonuclease